MRKKYEQMSLFDTYKNVTASIDKNKPKLFRLLDEHIDWDDIISSSFYTAFYRRVGHTRDYSLEGFEKDSSCKRFSGTPKTAFC
jgi:hypothetical protein